MSATKQAYAQLSQEDIDDSWSVIHRFFDYSSIDTLKENMWEWIKTTVSGTFNSQQLDETQRYDMLHLYEQVMRLIEAVHLAYQHQAGGQKQMTHQKKKKRAA